MRYPSPPSTLRVAVAQTEVGPSTQAQIDRAVEHLDDAAARGAQLVVFPEGYPGPLKIDDPADAQAPLAAAAARTGCAVYWSRVEAGASGWETVGYLVDERGRTVARYPRSHPATGDVHPVLNGAPMMPGEALVSARVHGVHVGLLVCSELWLPEVARILVLRRAEVLLAPVGGSFGRVAGNWQVLARARAIENQCHLALTQNLIGPETGVALIAGPEHDLAATTGPGVAVATLDLDQARWLRAQDDGMADPKPFSSLPGLLRARRPHLYGELANVQQDLYDYHAADAPVDEA